MHGKQHPTSKYKTCIRDRPYAPYDLIDFSGVAARIKLTRSVG